MSENFFAISPYYLNSLNIGKHQTVTFKSKVMSIDMYFTNLVRNS